ncbi:hypothetical protein [Nitrososphaera sp.]|uniref:hypothetical protein n=1 Tax=Nitrososphaera sp. TaxID=1971748 RepID=UPI00180FF1D5|nr:hypothetical protein [Nitrososphaera sp.]NWG37682.1 hypothetical protein [Nitrososphaera sp.]
MEVSLESVFASRKAQDKNAGPVAPGAFQVSAKIDEESRKDNRLVLSFLLTLSEPKSLVTYEFRGTCAVTGSPADFDGMMEVAKGGESRLPRILDAIYQRVYPAVFMLAGLTSSSYPQSTTLGAESVKGLAAEQEEPGAKVADGNGNGEAKPLAARRPVQKAKRKTADKPAEEEKSEPVVEEKPAESAEKPATAAAPVGAPALPQGR